jgi:KDO2-lipid IV(A) lauroyltransferase
VRLPFSKQRRHRLEDGLAAALFSAARVLPRPALLRLGAGVGRVVGALDRRHLAIAASAMARAFPDWSEGRVAATARGVYAHIGKVLVDVAWMARRGRDEIVGLMDVEGREHVEAALASRRGIVFTTAHIGNWEVCGVAHGWNYAPMSVVYRPLDNPLLDRRLAVLRERSGNVAIDKRRALGQLLRRLRRGEAVALLVDQNVQEQDGIFVRFFGRPAATTTSAALLHLKTGATLMGGFTRLGPDGRYRMRYEAPIRVEPSGDRERDVARITQALNDMIEGWVREVPEQWLWIHRRWHTQPRSDRA